MLWDETIAARSAVPFVRLSRQRRPFCGVARGRPEYGTQGEPASPPSLLDATIVTPSLSRNVWFWPADAREYFLCA